MAVEECGNIIIKLTGGPMDGDHLLMAPAGSCGPPQQLCYMTATPGDEGEAGWMVYEARNAFVGGWPEPGTEERIFDYVGTYDLGKGRRLK